MMKAQIWVKKKADMSLEDFREHWLNVHAPIARDGYENLRGYVVHLVTGAPRGTEPIYDGVAELTWEDRDGFVADMQSDAAKRGTEDLKGFSDGFGMVYVETHTVK